jgi:hypothetical protein
MSVQYFAVRRDKKVLETMALRLLFLFCAKTVLLSTFMYPVISTVHKVQALHCPALGCAVHYVPPCSLTYFYSLFGSDCVIMTHLDVLSFRK